jgi:Domain of unknown function DUF29
MSAYDTDVLAWSEQQAGLLRRRASGELVNDTDLDWPHIAEEIESLGQSERYRLRSHIGTVIEHLIKLEASPANDPRNGWKTSVRNARRGIRHCLTTSPSLRREIGQMVLDETRDAQQDVAATLQDYGEQPRVVIEELTYTEQQVVEAWFPEDPVSRP